jgi:hypothetical protein
MPNFMLAFVEEMEKISASLRLSQFSKIRRGKTPIRIANALKKAPPIPPAGGRVQGMLKKASAKQKALEGTVTARPYISSAVTAAVPAAMLGTIYGGPRMGKAFGAVGASLGVGNQALKDWAERNKRKQISKKILGV